MDCSGGSFCSEDPVSNPSLLSGLAFLFLVINRRFSNYHCVVTRCREREKTYCPYKFLLAWRQKRKEQVFWLRLADREPVTDQPINTKDFKYTVSQKKPFKDN